MVANDGNAAVSLFGLESRADDDRLLTRPNELSQSRKRYEKALEKGLQNAKAQVDQFYQEDNKFPDLYDRLLNQTEPQNYFFEPYVTQWRPQIVKKGSLVTYPSVVASSIEETKTLTLSGLLEEISHAWTSVDNRLFVWNYRNLKQFAALEFDQAIVAVSLCESPASGIFTEKVQHLLVVATTVNISLVAVLFDPFVSPGSSAGSTSLALKLQRTKLGVSTDNCVVRSIVCTQHGRIFFGGSDGTLYELCYGPEGTSTPVKGLLPSFFTSSDATPRCSKVAHTTNYSNYLPSFLVGFAGSLDKIHQIALDSERNVLYVLHDQAHVEVFDLGHNAKDLKLVCSLNLLSAGTKYAREYRRTRVSCPDEKLFQKASTGDATTTDPVKFIYICPVPRNESLFITLLAVTSNGLRCYLTVYSKSTYIASALGSRADNEKASIVQNKRPTRLEMVYIRLPPPAVDVNDSPPYHTKEGMQPGFVPGKSPSQIHSAYYRDGVFLIANGGKDKQDQFIGIAYDAIATTLKSIHKPAIRESISLDNTLGKVIEIKGFGVNQRKISSVSSAAGSNDGISSGSKRSFDTMAKAGKSTSGNEVIIGEMTSQFSEPPRHFITLTNAGIQLYRKIRPLDQLHRVLLISKGSELKQVLAPFVRCFGETEVCSMLLAIACGVQSDSIEAYSSVSSDMTPSLANGVIDEYLHSAAIQGIFDCGLGLAKVRKASTARKSSANENEQPSFIASSARVILKSESEMSYYHDALILFLSRVMRPLWQNKDGKLSTDTSNNTWEMVYDINKLCEIREVLFQLRQLMENTGPFSVAVSSGAPSLEASAVQKSLGKNAHGSEAGETDISRVSQLSERFAETRSDDQLKQEKRYRMEQQSLYFQYRFVCRSIEVISLLDVLDKYKSTPSENLLTFNFGDLVASTEGVEVARAAIRTLMQSNENEQNAQLIQHLRAQCPSFFSVPDLWQYQGYKSLSSAKLSTAPSAQRKYLQEALSQFLKSCHMWNSEDGIEVLRNTCEDLIALHFYEGVVRLSLACARNFSSETKFDKTPIHSPFVVATGVSTREKTRLLKQNCFGPILLALQKLLPSTTSSASDMATSHRNWYSKKKPKNQTTMNELVCLDEESRRRYVDEILHLALASEDEDLHILLYSWLMEHGQTRTLLSIRTPYIEPFLQSQNRDLLIQLYMEQQKYLLAANVWWELAREDHTESTFDVDSDMNGMFTEQAQGLRDHELKIVDRALLERNPDISKRQYYISKTLACLKNMEQSGLNEDANSVDATREVLDIMDVLNLQARIFTSLNQSLTELEADVDFSVEENSAFTQEISRRRDDVTLLKYKMLSPTTLYNQFAVKYSMWAECLHIIRVCRSEESNTVEALWRKIIFDVIPRSSNDSQFNNWLAKMRQEARLTEISADVSTSFESGVWIGQVQCIVQRLGRILLNDDRRAAGDVGYTYTSNGMDRFLVFPVTFLLRELETLSSWYIRATQLSVSAATTLDIGAFNWVVRLFVDVGLPYQIILGNYEELYREQGNFSWGIHLMRSIKAAINMWRKHSIISGDRNEELSNLAICVPHLVEFCDDILTDLQAVPPDAGCEDVFELLDDYRDLKRQLINFRNIS